MKNPSRRPCHSANIELMDPTQRETEHNAFYLVTPTLSDAIAVLCSKARNINTQECQDFKRL